MVTLARQSVTGRTWLPADTVIVGSNYTDAHMCSLPVAAARQQYAGKVSCFHACTAGWLCSVAHQAQLYGQRWLGCCSCCCCLHHQPPVYAVPTSDAECSVFTFCWLPCYVVAVTSLFIGGKFYAVYYFDAFRWSFASQVGGLSHHA